MGLPTENDLLATTSGQIMEPESKFGTQRNLLSLTCQSINININKSRYTSHELVVG